MLNVSTCEMFKVFTEGDDSFSFQVYKAVLWELHPHRNMQVRRW